jgi:hypothetical protein
MRLGRAVQDRSEHAALEAPVGEFGEEALDGIEPGGGSRREVEGPARVFCEPFLDFFMLVGGVIVDDRVDRLSLADLRVDLIEVADELLMPMTFHVAADDGAIENVEPGEQCGRAVALLVVGHRTGPSRLHRQSRLGAVEGLDLAFFVNREDNGVGGRIDVETDHVPEFFGELRIVRPFECPDTMGRELVGLIKLIPTVLASIRPVHWVVSPGGGLVTRSMTFSTVAAGSGGLPGLRVLSRSSPSTPSAMNRACHRQTTGLALPDRRMTSVVPQPSAVARMICVRHTCFCGALRSDTIASRRRRSARATWTTINFGRRLKTLKGGSPPRSSFAKPGFAAPNASPSIRSSKCRD